MSVRGAFCSFGLGKERHPNPNVNAPSRPQFNFPFCASARQALLLSGSAKGEARGAIEAQLLQQTGVRQFPRRSYRRWHVGEELQKEPTECFLFDAMMTPEPYQQRTKGTERRN